jgi:hypothetical protein
MVRSEDGKTVHRIIDKQFTVEHFVFVVNVRDVSAVLWHE